MSNLVYQSSHDFTLRKRESDTIECKVFFDLPDKTKAYTGDWISGREKEIVNFFCSKDKCKRHGMQGKHVYIQKGNKVFTKIGAQIFYFNMLIGRRLANKREIFANQVYLWANHEMHNYTEWWKRAVDEKMLPRRLKH